MFRDQDLTPAQQLAFAETIGTPDTYPFVDGIEGHPTITPVLKLPHETVNFGGVWHSDTAYLERLPMATLLLARDLPPVGGDTLFASQTAAYAALSDGMKRMLGFAARREPVGRSTSPRPGRTASPPVPAPPTATSRRSTRWCAPIPRPAPRRSTSIAPTRCGSTA